MKSMDLLVIAEETSKIIFREKIKRSEVGDQFTLVEVFVDEDEWGDFFKFAVRVTWRHEEEITFGGRGRFTIPFEQFKSGIWKLENAIQTKQVHLDLTGVSATVQIDPTILSVNSWNGMPLFKKDFDSHLTFFKKVVSFVHEINKENVPPHIILS